jgi:uncharacterized membrane protein
MWLLIVLAVAVVAVVAVLFVQARRRSGGVIAVESKPPAAGDSRPNSNSRQSGAVGEHHPAPPKGEESP